MARDTDVALRNLVIYSVFVRNHTQEGTFRAVIPDLPRIRALGADAVWLMPIHPIGKLHRKGTLGSPYANRDYRTVNPEYGTMNDFVALVDAIHANGMKCLIDVVYNHTSPDSVLYQTHPEFFYRRPDGKPGNHVGDWSDVIDLDYNVPQLWDYQIESLCQWARIVDGFRCDVASFVPVEFWQKARAEVAKVNPHCIWLAETVHRSFGRLCRTAGMCCQKDTRMFDAFDMEYSYDIQETFERYLKGEVPLSTWLDLMDFQESVYPDNYDKLRFLENHDLPRIASRAGGPRRLRNLTAMLYLLNGTTLIYAGQEVSATRQPSLFDKDTIDWSALNASAAPQTSISADSPHDFDAALAPSTNLSPLMRSMADVKKSHLSPTDFISFEADDKNDVAVIVRRGASTTKIGAFALTDADKTDSTTVVNVAAPDGVYRNLIDGSQIKVAYGKAQVSSCPFVIELPNEPIFQV
ncbi:MAG: alpha-amylase family glycosyl hydrolase [Atopobiaceae bacterium]